MLNKRFMSAFVGILSVFLILRVGGLLLLVAIGVLIYLGLGEFYELVAAKGAKPNTGLGLAGSLVLLSIAYLSSIQFDLPFSVYSVIIIITYILLLKNLLFNQSAGASAIFDSAVTILGILYVGGFFAYFILVYNFTLSGEQLGTSLIWIPLISSWLTDTFAYLVGIKFGKHALAPNVSPNKTIEGALGGIIGSVLGIFIYSLWFPLSIKELIVLGFVLSVFAQLGDLVASSFKRDAQVKDSGTLIPGHGGILDRFDSLLFTLPLFYYLLKFFS